MISKAKLKLITALRSKKQRQKYHIFSAEGTKIIHEIIQQAPLSIHSIYALPTWLSENHTKLHFLNPEQIIEITETELQSISSLVTPNQVLALIKYNPTQLNPTTTPIQPNIHLVLDNIQDPGNLGTIWRIADWFAIPNIFCSPNCADPYNTKTIQASMGAFLRVNIYEISPQQLFQTYPNIPILGATLQGTNLFQTTPPPTAFVVIGNESTGISPDILPLLTHRITIPAKGGAESLNAAVATGIICAHLTQF